MEYEGSRFGQAGMGEESPNIPVMVMIGLIRSPLLIWVRLMLCGSRRLFRIVLVMMIMVVVVMRDVKHRFHIF